jgi:hypothetical protein
MIVSSQLFEAYLECSTKCWLRSRAEPTTGNFYAEWARPQNETYLEYGLKRAFATVPESDRATAPPIPKNPKDVTWCLAIDVRWRTRDLESRLQAVERIPSEDLIDHAKPTLHHSAELVGLFVRYEINACSKADRSSDHCSCHDRRNSSRHVLHLRK